MITTGRNPYYTLFIYIFNNLYLLSIYINTHTQNTKYRFVERNLSAPTYRHRLFPIINFIERMFNLIGCARASVRPVILFYMSFAYENSVPFVVITYFSLMLEHYSSVYILACACTATALVCCEVYT